MTETETTAQPDWETPLSTTISAGSLIETLFSTASDTHTGWSSCIEDEFVISNLTVTGQDKSDYCRLIEQEYIEEDQNDLIWHDWTVEIHLGDIYIAGHWQIPSATVPIEWEWCEKEATFAFEKACVLFGRKVRRALAIEETLSSTRPPNTRQH